MENRGWLWTLRLLRTKTFPWELSSLGIMLNPYYVFQEGLFGEVPVEFDNELEDYETRFLCANDMKAYEEVYNTDGRHYPAKKILDRLKKGNKCFIIKKDNKIIGYTWCDFTMFTYPPNFWFKINQDEVYLFDMYILKASRGKKIAPYLRYQCYHKLSEIGRHIFLSYSDYFNRPAIRFKEKLNARLLRMCLNIRLFDRFEWNITLKDYPKNVQE